MPKPELRSLLLFFTLAVATAHGGEPDGSAKGDPEHVFGSSFEAGEEPVCEEDPPVAFRAGTSELQRFDARRCRFEDLFLKGVNLGVATPGKYAGDLETAADYDDFLRWFGLMTDAGINLVRVYTLHMDFFYDALRDFNLAREEAGKTPLYLAHGIWLGEEAPAVDLYSVSVKFSTNIFEAVHAVHGNITLDFVGRPGKGYGTYTSDVSPWVIAWIIGREVHPDEIELTNEMNPTVDSYEGAYLSLPSGSAAEAWVTGHMDEVLFVEKNTYGEQRPISFSSWPTLDPLSHPTEYGSPVSGEDAEQIDLGNIDISEAPAGVFYSFHAYPYYPDFMSEDPGFREFSDEFGPNNYPGYLERLRDHYAGRPVLIAEVGVPSSWGNVHYSFSGMHHGGHDELTQGEFGGRLLGNIHAAGMAGGVLFAWIDEWWKPTWLTNEFDFPFSRRAYWHNIAAPEQNYGLLGFKPQEAPEFVDLAWTPGAVNAVSAFADTTFYRLRLALDAPLKEGDELLVVLDTYADTRGEIAVTTDSTVPANRVNGTLNTTVRGEFLVHLHDDTGVWQAQLYVGGDYDLYGLWGGEHTSALRSPETPTGRWNPVIWKNNYIEYDGLDQFDQPYDSFYANSQNIEFNAGRLRVRSADDAVTSKDAVIITDDQVELRLPWGLLQFTDPSQHRVFHDDPGTLSTTQESQATAGIAQAIIINGELAGETERFLWPKWFSDPFLSAEEQSEPMPAYTEQIKASYFAVKAAIAEIGGQP